MVTHETIKEQTLLWPGTRLKHPFDPDLPVLFVGSKMFALLGTHSGFPSINLKADPDTVWITRETYPEAVLPGYHMNKRHWNTVLLNGQVPDKEIMDMVEESYLLVRSKLTKAEQQSLTLAREWET